MQPLVCNNRFKLSVRLAGPGFKIPFDSSSSAKFNSAGVSSEIDGVAVVANPSTSVGVGVGESVCGALMFE